MRRFRGLCLLPLLACLPGCDVVLLHPAGDVAMQQRNMLIASTLLMLLIIVPVLALTVVFAWRYRHGNTGATYEPDWHHSNRLEVAIWAAPLTIVVVLGALTWIGTHLLDPYRSIGRIAPGRPVSAGMQPLIVDAVALDWKWLFIYPGLGIATVNELATPIDVPLDFRITSSSMMNSFFVPAMAGQIYAMPGMETQLHAVMNRAGTYRGFSANYTGAGFSDMNFAVRSMSATDFAGWVDGIRHAGGSLDRARYLTLEKPSEHEPVHRYASVTPDLFKAIVNECVAAGEHCVSAMQQDDATSHGGASTGMAGMAGMTANEHGRHEGALGADAPQAPPSRRMPNEPDPHQ